MTTARGLDAPILAEAEEGLDKVAKEKVQAVSIENQSLTSLEAEFDEAHAGLEFPTEHDKLTLKKVSDTLPYAAYCSSTFFLCRVIDLTECYMAVIAVVEMAERFSFYGCTIVFTNYIQQPLPPGSHTGAGGPGDGQSGSLGLGQQTSTGIVTFYSFWCYMFVLELFSLPASITSSLIIFTQHPSIWRVYR
jgi:proton-dependent oligopeptide transporter, POT family